jgi:3-phosphoinositide dependent protein kinase-1
LRFLNLALSGDCRQQFLLPGERIVFTALVKKHKGFSSKKRQLLLTNTPRLMYVDPVKMVLMGTIPWTSDLSVRVESPCNFLIRTVSVISRC